MVNPAPVGVAFDKPADAANTTPLPSPAWVQWIQQVVGAINGFMTYTSSTVLTPVTGFSIVISGSAKLTTLTPAGTLATGTIKMPPSPVDGWPVQVATTQVITALTVSPNTGQTIKNAPTTLAAGTSFFYYYNATLATWFRLQ